MTQEEKQKQIDGLIKLKEELPEFSFFGDNNWKPIDAMISMLMGLTTYEDFIDDEPNVESEALRCQNWLNGEDNSDLFC